MQNKKKQPGVDGRKLTDWIWSPELNRLEQIEREADEQEEYEEVVELEADGPEESDEPEISRDEIRHAMVEKLIDRIGQQLDAKDMPSKASVADLIRLMQLERALKPLQCGRFVVEWIDPKPEDM